MGPSDDAGGNLVNRYDASNNETFSYDFLDRLIDAYSNAYSDNWTYNAIGNIMSHNGTNYVYSGYRPHAVSSIGGIQSYQYDANGNMDYRDEQDIAWDAENRVISAGSSNFTYDGDSNRVKKIENGQTTLYINKYFEVNLSTSTNTSYYYLADRLIAVSENATLRYIHQDHLTGTSVVSDASGNSLGVIHYMPFGECLESQGNLATDRLFTGQRLDQTGLYYYGARYYDPTIGRFISADIYMKDFMLLFIVIVLIRILPLTRLH